MWHRCTRIQRTILQDECRIGIALRRYKDAKSPLASLAKPALEHFTAPFHKFLVLGNCSEKWTKPLGLRGPETHRHEL